MRKGAKLSISAAAIAVFGVSGLVAIRDGVVDTAVNTANIEMLTWGASGAAPGVETQRWVREDLEWAVARVSDDPVTHELLGTLALRGLSKPDDARVAYERYRETLQMRPSSPYTWMRLAELKYRTGDTGAKFEDYLQRAAELGHAEPEIQREGAFLGLAVYDDLSAPARAAVDTLLQAGIRRDTPEMMRISRRRGRLDVTCGLASGMASGIDSKSSQSCQGTE
ncbi:MAG TPA: hypothetical protein VKR38_03705 [Usitatibacter sp.]|nr:hypothetical protein [Usitatibacter sp.]